MGYGQFSWSDLQGCKVRVVAIHGFGSWLQHSRGCQDRAWRFGSGKTQIWVFCWESSAGTAKMRLGGLGCGRVVRPVHGFGCGRTRVGSWLQHSRSCQDRAWRFGCGEPQVGSWLQHYH